MGALLFHCRDPRFDSCPVHNNQEQAPSSSGDNPRLWYSVYVLVTIIEVMPVPFPDFVRPPTNRDEKIFGQSGHSVALLFAQAA